jgi:hypothetical protein
MGVRNFKDINEMYGMETGEPSAEGNRLPADQRILQEGSGVCASPGDKFIGPSCPE